MTDRRKRRTGDDAHPSAGFSLVEGLAALALTGLTMAGVASLTAQWIPGWNRGVHKVQQADLFGVALERIVSDISAAQFITPEASSNAPFFDGAANALTFVRPSLNPSELPGLEVVRFKPFADERGAGLLRQRARFTPLPPSVTPGAELAFTESVVVLRTDAAFSFSYAGRDGVWRQRWADSKALPRRVRIDVVDRAAGAVLPVSTTALVRVNVPPRCAVATSYRQCIGPGALGTEPERPMARPR